jgi:hypothetical protein
MNFHYSSTPSSVTRDSPNLWIKLNFIKYKQTNQPLNTDSTGQPLKEATFIDETKRKQLTTQTNQLHQIDKLAQTTNT